MAKPRTTSSSAPSRRANRMRLEPRASRKTPAPRVGKAVMLMDMSKRWACAACGLKRSKGMITVHEDIGYCSQDCARRGPRTTDWVRQQGEMNGS